MVLLEAMSQGIACISYDCISGPSDIIEHGINGILVEDQNAGAMADALAELLENEELRRKLQRNAPGALEAYSLEQVTEKWKSLFDEVMTAD